MKLIKPRFEILEQPSGLEGIYKQIELCGRVAYKSEDKITEDSAKEFVERMIKSKHGAVLEHGTVYLRYNDRTGNDDYFVQRYSENPYSSVSTIYRDVYVTTNFRVLIENGWLDDLKYICEPTAYHEKRATVRFICDRGVSHEFVKHRVFSFVQESTRFCNYSKDKFNNEVTFIIPCWLNLEEQVIHYGDFRTCGSSCVSCVGQELFINSLLDSEDSYLCLLKNGWTPQQARSVLPNSLKTELIMTGFLSDWRHFFELRTPSNAHPQAKELAIPLQEELIKRGLIKE